MTDQPIHLTLTGYWAGVTLCGVPRTADGLYTHAMYAPLANPAWRVKCCPACVASWGYDDDDPGDHGQMDLFPGHTAAGDN